MAAPAEASESRETCAIEAAISSTAAEVWLTWSEPCSAPLAICVAAARISVELVETDRIVSRTSARIPEKEPSMALKPAAIRPSTSWPSWPRRVRSPCATAFTTPRNSSRSRSSLCSARWLSVTSLEMPTSPTIVPVASRSGTLEARNQRSLCLSCSRCPIRASPVRISRRSSSIVARANSGGKKSRSERPLAASGLATPSAAAWARLMRVKRDCASLK